MGNAGILYHQPQHMKLREASSFFGDSMREFETGDLYNLTLHLYMATRTLRRDSHCCQSFSRILDAQVGDVLVGQRQLVGKVARVELGDVRRDGMTQQ